MATDRGKIVPYSVFESYATKEGEKSRALPTDRFGAEYSAYGLVEPIYGLDTLVYLQELNTWHARCCNVKANDVAGLGYGLMLKAPHVSESAQDAKVHAFFEDDGRHGKPVSRILTDVEQDFQATGCLALEVVRELYDPFLPPYLMAHVAVHTVRVHSTGNKFCQIRGAQRRWFKAFGYDRDVDMRDGREYALGTLDPNLRASELVWDRAASGRSDYYGMPQILPALGAIEGMRVSRNYNLSFFKNYGIPSYAIYISGDYNLGTPVRVKLEDNGSGTLGQAWDPNAGWTRAYFEYPMITTLKNHMAKIAENPHAPMILAVPGQSAESKVTVDIKPLSVEVKDASFRMLRKDDRDEILTAHGTPGYRLGINETGSLGGSTAVESTRIYRDSVISPRKESLASLINVTVVAAFEGSLEFYFNPLDLAEEDHEKDVAQFLFEHGAMTPNELRVNFGEQFGLAKVENAPSLDSFYLAGQPIHTGEVKMSTSTLNGAQVASLLQVLAAVAAGTLSQDAAATVIEKAFLIPAEDARKMLGADSMVEAVKGLRDRLMEIANGD